MLYMAGLRVDLVAHGLGLGGLGLLGHNTNFSLFHHHRSDPHRLIELGGPQAGRQPLAFFSDNNVTSDTKGEST